MDFKYTTDRLVLMTGDPLMAPLVLDYLKRNRADFERWSQAMNDGFYTLDFQREALLAEQKLFFRSAGVRYYMFLKDDPDSIIGNVSFAYLTEEEGHRCTIGYKTDMNYRRNGYAYEAVSFLLPLIHSAYHVKRIEADILEENAASLGLIKKLGFEYEGIARCSHTVAGRDRDHMRFSMVFR